MFVLIEINSVFVFKWPVGGQDVCYFGLFLGVVSTAARKKIYGQRVASYSRQLSKFMLSLILMSVKISILVFWAVTLCELQEYTSFPC